MNMVFMESQLGKHKTVPMSLSDERDCPGSVAAKHSLSQTFVDHSVLVLYTCWINGGGMTHLARLATPRPRAILLDGKQGLRRDASYNTKCRSVKT